MKQYKLKGNLFEKDFKIDYKNKLNKEQYRIVTEADGPCLVLAGAGSGKTRTLVYRLVYLLEKGISPNRILLVTFTNKAAKEMLYRSEALYGGHLKGLWGGTFHSIANRMLRIYGNKIGIENNFSILDQEDSKTMIKSCFVGLAVPNDKYFPKAALIGKIIGLSRNLSLSVEEVILSRFSHIDDNYISIISQIAEKYQEKKQKANALDFDDLLVKWNELLVNSPEIKEKLSKQFKYILVDEYQDTNHIQGEIIKHLAGDDQNILVVGDDSQSIYSFRGADINNILTFPEVFKNCQTYRLEKNYRSRPEILTLANNSISYNTTQFEKQLVAERKKGEKPVLASLDDNYEQARFVCQRILELQTENGERLEETAVLFRAHYQSLELEMELNKKNIPYIIRGGIRYFEQAHIKDVVAHLKIINNFKDEVSWQRVLRLYPGIGLKTAEKIWQAVALSADLKQAIMTNMSFILPNRAMAVWQKCADLLQTLLQLGEKDVSAMINIVLNNSYAEYLKNNFDNYQDRVSDLEQLVSFAGNYNKLDDFLADAVLSEGFQNSDTEASNNAQDALILSTIHQAKGLEWKNVFLIGMCDGQFPNAKACDSDAGIEEERRLFYVACTRAKDRLYLTYPLFSQRSDDILQLSQFVKELDESLYESWQVSEETDASSNEERYVSDDDEYQNEKSISDRFWEKIRRE